MELQSKELDEHLKMMEYTIEDEETGEIIGIRPDAPEDAKALFDKMMAEMKSTVPVER